MKKQILVLIGLVIASTVFTQAPPTFSFQAVIRDTNNQVVSNSQVGMMTTILQGAEDGTIVYREIYHPNPATNINGLITLQVGNGITLIGDFESIDWSEGPYFIQTETDPTGGTNYTITGVTQLMSVPYALHAKTVDGMSFDFEEEDPVFLVSPASGILTEDIDNWDAAYDWGDHSEEGYLTEENQALSDVLFLGNDANETQIKNLGEPTDAKDAATKDYVDLLQGYIDDLLERVEALEEALYHEDPEFNCGDNITFTYRGDEVTYGTILRNGLCWLDRDLGADPMPFIPAVDATGNTDTRLYGDLFQWGRLGDGHQDRTSSTTTTLSNTDVPEHGDYIIADSEPFDWRSPQNDILWQGEDGINNPCPPDWRIPTVGELDTERQSWSPNNSEGAYSSALRWPLGGFRHEDGTLGFVGSRGYTWSSSVSGTDASLLYFRISTAMIPGMKRVCGMSVRCVRDIDN